MVAKLVPARYSGDVTQTTPLLSADAVRIDDGGPVLEELTVTTEGDNVAVVGAPRALYEAACGLRDTTAGALLVCGLAPREAARSGAVASAPVDAKVPARWTVLELARQSALLAGRGRRESERLAADATRAMQLEGHARARLGGADPAVRRAAMLSAAIATGAPVLLLEDFTPGLPDGAARALARLFVQAARGRRWALFAGRLALSSPLGLETDEAVLFVGGRFACASPPAELAARGRTFSVRTSAGEGGATFAGELRQRGATVESADAAGRAFTVTLAGELTTLDVLATARAAGVVVMELLPLSGAVA